MRPSWAFCRGTHPEGHKTITPLHRTWPNSPTQHTKPRDEILSAHAPHTAPYNETFTAPARHKQPKFAHFHHAGANFLSQHTPHTHTRATFLSTNRPKSSPNTSHTQLHNNRRATLRTNRNQQNTRKEPPATSPTVGQDPRKVARNSIGRSSNKVRKRCNSNDLNSMFERVAGELRATLGTVSAMRQLRSGRDTCAVATGPGRAIHSDLAPLVWRAPEGPAAVPVGSGSWPGYSQRPSPTGVEGAEGTCRGAGGRRRGLAGLFTAT